MTTWRKSQEGTGLNSRHIKLPVELREAIVKRVPVEYWFYEKYKDIYSSKRLQVRYDCVVCGTEHLSDFKHLNKRKLVKRAICPKCVMGVATSDPTWRKANSDAQMKIQSLPSHKRKNAEGVSRFWRENPDRLKSMAESVRAAQNRPDVREKYANRQFWNGRGISGDYLSKWGWLTFDSSYELAFIVAMEQKSEVALVCRGPIIEYELDGEIRQYFVDYEVKLVNGAKYWYEVKSGYIGERREKAIKLRAKMNTALELVKRGHADNIILLHEGNSEELIGVKMPRSSYRTKLFRDCYDKIIFANSKHDERFK